MLRALAIRYGVAWTPGAFAQFSGAVGGGALVWWLLRYGFRELLKLIPMVGTVAAGALNAAAAFAVTVGIGEAACVWLAYRRRGLTAPDRRGAPRLRGWTCGWAAAGEESSHASARETAHEIWPNRCGAIGRRCSCSWRSRFRGCLSSRSALCGSGRAGMFGSGRLRPPLFGLLAWPLSSLFGGARTRRRASRLAIWPSLRVAGTSLNETLGPRCSQSRMPPHHFPSPKWIRSSPAPVTVEVVARRFHPEARTAWAQFSLPEFLLLTERLCRDVRREALRHIPGVQGDAAQPPAVGAAAE